MEQDDKQHDCRISTLHQEMYQARQAAADTCLKEMRKMDEPARRRSRNRYRMDLFEAFLMIWLGILLFVVTFGPSLMAWCRK